MHPRKCACILTECRWNLMYGFTFYGKNVECSYIFYFNWSVNFGKVFFFFLLCLVAWPSTICLKKCGDIWVIKFFIIIFIEVYFSFYDVLPLFGDSLWMLDPTRPEKPLWKMTSMILSAQTLLNFECIKEILVVTTIVNGYMDMFQLSS